MKKIPQRMCVACRKMFPKNDLIRVVKDESGISVDLSHKKNGRGAYICGEDECLKKMFKQKSLNKVFACAVDDSVYEKIKEVASGRRSEN